MEDDWQALAFDFDGFEWDNEKADSNWRKHGIDFEDAKRIFQGIALAQAQFENEEDRWQSIGIAKGREIVVVIAERGRFCRIISARSADRKARRRYYEIYSR